MDAVLDIIKNSPEGCTALDIENIRHILKNTNININVQDSQGRTALILCCNRCYNSNNKKVIKLLLKNGIDVNIQDNYGRTSLLCCCLYQNTEIINLLIKCKVNVNQQDNNGSTALMISSINPNDNDIEIAKLLLMSRVRNNANIYIQNFNGCTAIMNTLKYGSDKIYPLKMSQLLLEYDAKLDNNIYAHNIAKLNALS